MNKKSEIKQNRSIDFLLLILQIGVVALLIGRGWQFLSKSTPFNAFFFHPVFMHPIIENVYGIDWKEYLNNPEWYAGYKKLVRIWGVFLMLGSVFYIGMKKIPVRIIKSVSIIFFLLLFFLAFCYYIEKGFRLGQFVEYASQVSSPIILWYFFQHYFLEKKTPSPKSTFVFFIKIMIALTFIGHALFALGYYPIPGYFVDMIIKSFGMTESAAKTFLSVVGWLDIIAALLLFIPFPKWQKIGLYYIVGWGFLTALARVYANVSYGLGWYSLKQWLPEFLMRFPHFMLPLFLFFILRKQE